MKTNIKDKVMVEGRLMSWPSCILSQLTRIRKLFLFLINVNVITLREHLIKKFGRVRDRGFCFYDWFRKKVFFFSVFIEGV